MPALAEDPIAHEEETIVERAVVETLELQRLPHILEHWGAPADDYGHVVDADLVDEALLRVEDKEYGDCQNCEEPINPKRLAAIPWARYCLNCQELVEKGLLDEE